MRCRRLREPIHSGKSAESRRNTVWTRDAHRSPRSRPAAAVARLPDDDHRRLKSRGKQRCIASSLTAIVKRCRRCQTGEPSLLAPNRRAAERLGRMGDQLRLCRPSLAAALGNPADRALEHSLIYALIEIGDRQGDQG